MCKNCKSSASGAQSPVNYSGTVMQRLSAGEALVSVPGQGVVTASITGTRHVRPQTSISVVRVGGQWSVA